MQFQILSALFTLSFLIIASQNAENQILKTSSTSSYESNIEDTPSPEWVKYQQERFQDLDKMSAAPQNILKSHPSSDKNSSLVSQEFSKWHTTSRHEGFPSPQIKIPSDESENSNFKESGETFEENTSSSVEFPSIKGFIKFIKSIKQTWMKKSLFRFEDKIKMLHQLKDSLLKTIENQFKILWQDDNDDEDQLDSTEGRRFETENRKRNHGSHLRRKRGILGESTINFPPDAALISINFLTFAVFLIKLVLQVVNIIKTKHYQFSTLNMDTGVIRNG